ncbi:autotransporter assembly complex protein TamA [Shewanella cyperi]
MRGLGLGLAAALSWQQGMAADTNLELDIQGADERLGKNILAHLGDLPQTEVQRRAFLFNVEDAVFAALQSMGYYHGELEQQLQQKDKKPWHLALKLSPGQPVRLAWVDIRFLGDMLQDQAFDNWLLGQPLKPGDQLDHGRYEEVKSELSTLALSRGYFDADFNKAEIKVNRDLNLAFISLHFNSGTRYHFGEVSFNGHSLEPQLLEQLIPFDTDSPYGTRELGQFNGALQETGYFSGIKVLPELAHATEQHVPIRVELTPKPDHSIELGLGADIGSSSDATIEPRVRVTWRTPQINRYGHSQETSVEWSPDRPKFLTTYTLPLSHPLNDQLILRLGVLRDKYGVTQEYNAADDSYNNTGQLESSTRLLGIRRQQRLPSRWYYSYSLDFMREFYTQSDIHYDPRYFLAGVSLQHSRRNDTSLDPKGGLRQFYSLEYADPMLGSTVRLARAMAKFKWIDTFFDKHRLVARLDLGANWVPQGDEPLVPPSLRYFAGGDQSIRGYGYQELGPFIKYTADDGLPARQVVGGRFLTVASLEYQYYLTPEWRLATFVDGGNAFDLRQFEPAMSVGGGVHWISPIGPIKLDLGFGVRETDTIPSSWRIHLTMGAEL